MNELTKSIFDTILLLTENRIANLEYDKTLNCTIVDDSNKKNDKYTVSDGSVRFEAEGNGENYKLKDSVRVLIPNGDFSGKKYIQGRVSNEDSEDKPITYTSPLETVIDITDNLITEIGPWEIAAGSSGQRKEKIIDRIEIENPEIQSNKMLDSLYVSGEFFTTFNTYEMRQGDYGLHIVLGTIKPDGTNGRHDLFFSAKNNMFGNIYSFKIYTKQEMKYILSNNNENLVCVQISLYQDDNFKYYRAGETTLQNFTPLDIDGIEISNIKVKNVCLKFGSNIARKEDNSVELYTNDSLTFDHLADADQLKGNEKKLRLMWYNKTPENKYIGFSDGKVNLSYDEKNYLNQIADNTRLLNELSPLIPGSEKCLNLSATGKEIGKWGSEAADLIGRNLYEVLRGFRDYTKTLYDPDNHIFDKWLESGTDGSLGDYANKLNKASQLLPEYYAKILQAAKLGEDANIDIGEKEPLESFLINAHNNIIDLITHIMKTLTDKLQTIYDEKISKGYDSFYSIYYSYNNKCQIILNSLKERLSNIKEVYPDPILKNDTNQVIKDLCNLADSTNANIGDDYEDQTTNPDFIEEWDNRYCIYWYRYNPEAAETAFLPAGWEEIEGALNKGLPSNIDSGYYPIKVSLTDSNSYAQLTLDKIVKEERYKVVLFYNHKKFESNELVFTNRSPVPDVTTIDKAGALSIENVEGGGSQDSYQLHGSNGFLLNAADAQRRRKIRARFDSSREGVSEVDQLNGAIIYWYVPNRATMIEAWDTDFKDDTIWHTNRLTSYRTLGALESATESGAAKKSRYYLIDNIIYEWGILEDDSDEEGWKASSLTYDALIDASNYKEGYDCFYRVINITAEKEEDKEKQLMEQTTFPYHICDFYLSLATQNGIFCKVVKNDTDFYAEKYFSFASYGNNGTAYTLALEPRPEQPMYVSESLTGEVDAQGNQISAPSNMYVNITLYDQDGTEIDIYNDQWELSLVGPGGEKYEVAPQVIDIDKGLDKIKNKLVGCIISVKNDAPEDIYGGILECTVKNIPFSDESEKKINLTSTIAIPHSHISTQYIEGTSSVVYNTDGTNPQYYKKPYVLYSSTNETKIANVTWDIRYYYYYDYLDGSGVKWYYYTIAQDPNGKIIVTHHGTPKPEGENSYSIANELLSIGYIPKLQKDNSLVPSPMYIDYEDDTKKVYPVAIATVIEEEIQAKEDGSTETIEVEQILWAQPIVIIQDRYFSSIINDWDEGILIDSDSSTILSTMMGAGRKNSFNEFEGVLMGDIQSNGDPAAKVGLYGYHNGAQSFGFKVDGTAFIGKNGAGRIEFDGNNSLIYSSNYGKKDEEGKSLGGMQLNLEDGTIKTDNFSLDKYGNITASNATLTSANVKGTITANYLYAQNGGNIAGWSIGSNSLKDGTFGEDSSFHMYSISNKSQSHDTFGTGNWMLSIGSNFAVKSDGSLYANSANLTNVNAKTGYLGDGWKISGNTITAYYNKMGLSNLKLTGGQSPSITVGGGETGYGAGLTTVINGDGITLYHSGTSGKQFVTIDYSGYTNLAPKTMISGYNESVTVMVLNPTDGTYQKSIMTFSNGLCKKVESAT